MKIGIVYTGTTPELIDDVNKQIHNVLGNDIELLTYSDATILSDVTAYGGVYSKPAAKLIGLYSQAIMDGAEAILNTCSSVGEIADSMKSFADVAGVPIVRIDEDMCREMKKILLSVAPVEAIRHKIDQSALVEDILKCSELGTSMVHLHVRDENACLTEAPEFTNRIIEEIRKY